MNVNFKAQSKIDIFDMEENLIGCSKVQMEDKNSIQINTPIGQEGQKILEMGQFVNAVYFTDVKLYKFTTRVINRFAENMHTKIFVLQKPEEYEVIQRRESVRVDYSIPIQYAIITEMEKDAIIAADLSDEVIKKEFFIRLKKGMTYNISAGGLGVYTPGYETKIEDYLLVVAEIDGIEEIMIMQVVKVVQDDLDRKAVARKAGLKRIYGRSLIEERIFQLIFKIMREQRAVK